MTIVLEPAAPSAQLADRAHHGHRFVELSVQGRQLVADLGERVGRQRRYRFHDLVNAVEATLARAWTDPGDSFPVLWCLDILGPEGPGPALDGTRKIHRAPRLGV